jgi:hypothetical protein
MTRQAGPDAWVTCHRTARDEGLAAGLTELCRTLGPGVLPCGPRGHALVPRELARSARRIWYDGVLSDRAAGRDTMLAAPLVGDEGLVALCHSQGWLLPPPRLPGSAQEADEAAGQAAAGWRIGLAWLRLGLSQRLREACLTYLGGREIDGGTLLGQQLVHASLADALIRHAVVEAVLAPQSPASLSSAEIRWLHGRLTQADRGLLRLLGGSGFINAEPGRCALVSELLADVYIGGGHAAEGTLNDRA